MNFIEMKEPKADTKEPIGAVEFVGYQIHMLKRYQAKVIQFFPNGKTRNNRKLAVVYPEHHHKTHEDAWQAVMNDAKLVSEFGIQA